MINLLILGSFVFDPVPDRYMTKELCDKVVSEKPFMLKYCHDKYKTQEMCDKAVDSLFLIGFLQVRWFKNIVLFFF